MKSLLHLVTLLKRSVRTMGEARLLLGEKHLPVHYGCSYNGTAPFSLQRGKVDDLNAAREVPKLRRCKSGCGMAIYTVYLTKSRY